MAKLTNSQITNTGGKLREVQNARMGRALQRLSAELYSRDTHFVLELVQNADDAGARDFKLCLDLRQHGTTSVVGPGMAQYQGPSILAYNSAQFQEADFASIQRIGDSLKKATSKGSKTGRFGIGFNSVRVLD